jgi:hypothetical protein
MKYSGFVENCQFEKVNIYFIHRPATKRNKDTALIAFLMFSIFYEHDVKVESSQFVELLVQSGLALATIKNYISSLKSKLNTLGNKTIAFNSPRLYCNYSS